MKTPSHQLPYGALPSERTSQEKVHLQLYRCNVIPRFYLEFRYIYIPIRDPDNRSREYVLLFRSLSCSTEKRWTSREWEQGSRAVIVARESIGRVQIDSLCSHLSAFLSASRIWAPASDYDEWLATTRRRRRIKRDRDENKRKKERESGVARELVQNKRAPSGRQQVGVAATFRRLPATAMWLSTIMDSSWRIFQREDYGPLPRADRPPRTRRRGLFP